MATGLNQSSEQLQGATSGVPKQSGDLQIEQPDTRTSEQKSPTKRRIFTATKEDPALIEQMKPEDSREMFSGMETFGSARSYARSVRDRTPIAVWGRHDRDRRRDGRYEAERGHHSMLPISR
jgi:hypothetical protein